MLHCPLAKKITAFTITCTNWVIISIVSIICHTARHFLFEKNLEPKLNQKHIGIVPQILGFSQTNICKNSPRFGGNAVGHGRGLGGRATFDQTARLVTPLHTTCFRKPRNRREVVCQSAGKLQHEGAADAKCETTHKH